VSSKKRRHDGPLILSLCAPCERRGIRHAGARLVNGEAFCLDCFTGGRADTAPADIAAARRSRQYYGLGLQAAAGLGISPDYLYHVLGGHKNSAAGRANHSRVYRGVAALVRGSEAIMVKLLELGIDPTRYGNAPADCYKALAVAAMVCHRLGGCEVNGWGNADELRRRMRQPDLARGDLFESVLYGCGRGSCDAHVIVFWRTDTDRPTVLYDSLPLALPCLDALNLIVADMARFGALLGAVRPLSGLIGTGSFVA
jgi:hypothetical protein